MTFFRKHTKRILLTLGVILVIGALGIHFIAPYGIIQPMRRQLQTSPSEYGLQAKSLSLTTDDTTRLVGYRISSRLTYELGAMILVHGIGSCKEDMLGLADMLSYSGIVSYVFDLRAHGQSGGAYCTYGFYEKEDIKAIVSSVITDDPELRIGIWGNSLGGAIALQALAIDPRIEYGIIESTFTDLRSVVAAYQARLLKIPLPIAARYALERAADIADFDPDEVQPVEVAREIRQPVLLAHGEEDERIAFENGQRIFANLASTDKEFVPVPEGRHIGLMGVGGEAYKQQLLAFIRRQHK